MDTMPNVTLQVNRRELVAALGHLLPLTDRSGQRPLLAHVRASVAGGELRLAATDYTAALELAVPAQAEGAGTFLIPAQDVAKALRSWSGDTLTITANPDTITFAAPGSQMPVAAVDAGLYPALDTEDLPARFTIDTAAIARALECSVPFCINNETRKQLMGVHVVVDKAGVRWEATDGHRMSVRDTTPEVAGEDALGDCIIPAAVLALWSRVLKGRQGQVTVSWGEKQCRLALADATLTVTLIDAKYPTLGAIIPAKVKHRAKFDPRALASAVKAASAMEREQLKAVGFRLEPGKIIVASAPTENGHAVQVLAAVSKGESHQIGFNGPYLLDLLKLSQGGTVEMGSSDALTATLWTFSDDPDFRAVVMPLRVEFDVPDASLPEPERVPAVKAPKPSQPVEPPTVARPAAIPQPVERVAEAACASEGAPAARLVVRIGKLGESRVAAVEHARSLARPVSREIPSPRRLAPASQPKAHAPAVAETPAEAPRSHNAFRPYPQAEAEPQPEAKRAPKGKRTPEQLRDAALKAAETRRLNVARKAAS